ncbi:thioredoxin [Weissella viridescens]|uniref:Thioredoxin n=1 Tax=Weissella viridescens TaxID=1629 RepID=A0A3P2RA77_WEIVI|nr:thioredoxin family protein [Weissella viridescens]RRG17334.1 thioredoxin [Weissella viridescens]
MVKRRVNNKKSFIAGLADMSVKQWLALVGMFVVLLGFGIGQYNRFIRSNRVVSTEQIRHAIEQNKTVVFYRDDCSSCRKTLPFILTRNILKHDLLLVNMNGPKNRHFKADYKLKSVPTLVNKTGSYSDLTTDRYFDALKAVEVDTGGMDFSSSPDPTVP